MACRLTTLGAFELEVDGRRLVPPSTQKARALVAYLVMHAGHDVSRERLLEIFWPDAEPERARDNLKTALWSVRRALRDAGQDPDGFVRATKSTVQWMPPSAHDARDFETLAGRGSTSADDEAIQRYGGDFLEGDYGEWATAQRERFEAIFEAALARRVGATGDARAARQLLERNPYDEGAYASLIEEDLSAERRIAAATLYERCLQALAELGVQPSERFVERYAPIAQGARAATTFKVAFAGRASELAELDGLCTRLLAGERGYVLLHGAAGLGKSALISQVATALEQRGVQVVWLRGLEGDTRPFGPWSDAYESTTGRTVESLAESARDEIIPALVSGFTRGLSPLAAVFVDDAHSLSTQALHVLAQFAAKFVGVGMATVVSSRPQGIHYVRAALAGVRIYDVALEPLDATGVAEIVRVSAGRPLHDLARLLFERTKGHPLFLTALLEGLVRSGRLQGGKLGWVVTQDPAEGLRFPESLLATIETRLRSRGDDAAAVACALALEPEASIDDLAAALELAEHRVLEAVDDLLGLGDIAESPLGGFEFAHDLVREVAARLLTLARRKRLHRTFADRLKGSPLRGATLRRARHERASADWLRAAAGFERAAIESLGQSALVDAAQRAREGLDVLQKLERSPESDRYRALLERCLVGAFSFGGDPLAAVPHAEAAVEFARSSGDGDALTRALLSQIIALSDVGSTREAYAAAIEAERTAAASENSELRVKALTQMCTLAMPLGFESEGFAAGERAYALAEQMDSDYLRASVCGQLAESAATWWRFAEGIRWVERALESARRVSLSARASAHFEEAVVAYALERLDQADRSLERALAASEDRVEEVLGRGGFGSDTTLYACRLLAGVVATARGAWEVALDEVNALRTAVPRLLRSRRFSTPLDLLQVDALLGRGAPEDVAEAARVVTELDSPDGFPTITGWSDHPSVARARVAARRRAHGARELLAEAVVTVERLCAVNPLDADRTFAKLSASAAEAGASDIALRADTRCAEYRRRRVAAAGPLWGGAST